MTMNIKAVIILIISYPFESFKLIYGSYNKALKVAKNKIDVVVVDKS